MALSNNIITIPNPLAVFIRKFLEEKGKELGMFGFGEFKGKCKKRKWRKK